MIGSFRCLPLFPSRCPCCGKRTTRKDVAWMAKGGALLWCPNARGVTAIQEPSGWWRFNTTFTPFKASNPSYLFITRCKVKDEVEAEEYRRP